MPPFNEEIDAPHQADEMDLLNELRRQQATAMGLAGNLETTTGTNGFQINIPVWENNPPPTNRWRIRQPVFDDVFETAMIGEVPKKKVKGKSIQDFEKVMKKDYFDDIKDSDKKVPF